MAPRFSYFRFVMCLWLLVVASSVAIWSPNPTLAQESTTHAMVLTKDGIPLTTPFYIRSGSSGTYLHANGRSVATGPLVKNDDRFIWVLENATPEHAFIAEDPSWYYDKMRGGESYRIANLKHGFYLTKGSGSASVYLSPTLPGAVNYWVMYEEAGARSEFKNHKNDRRKDIQKTTKYGSEFYKFVWDRPYSYVPRGALNFVSDTSNIRVKPGDMAGLKLEGNGVVARSGENFSDKNWTWHIEEAPKRDLAKLVFETVTAIRTSTGQDENTRFLFDALEFALEYGPGIYSLGASTGAMTTVNHGVGAVIKRGAKEGWKKVSRKLAERSAKNSMSAFARQSLYEAQKRAARLATQRGAWRAWASQGKTRLTTVLTEEGAKKAARSARKVALKNAYGTLAKKLGVKGGTRILSRSLMKEAGGIAKSSARNRILNKLLESTDRASGRDTENEGILETMFSSFGIDKTPDDLMIHVNDMKIWPKGGDGHRSIKARETLDVGYEYIFDRQKGIKLQLIEWDSASKDDNLGMVYFSTADLDGVETYDEAFIKDDEEGSMYSLKFALAPLYIPTERELDIEQRINVELDEEERQAKAAATINTFEKIRARYRAEIFQKWGEDGINAYDKAKQWDQDYNEACRALRDFQEVKYLNGKQSAASHENIIGIWRVGQYDKNGEKNRDATWTYDFRHDGTLVTPHAVGKWNHYGFDRKKIKYRQRVFDPQGGFNICGIYISIDDKNDQLHRRDGKHPVEEFIPALRVHGMPIAARYDPRRRLGRSRAIDLVHRAVDHMDPHSIHGIETNLNVPERGLALWMEKITEFTQKSAETNSGIEAAKQDIVGTWELGRYIRGRQPSLASDRLSDWVLGNDSFDTRPPGISVWAFTSDNLVVSDDGKINGTWRYLGDRRILIKTNAPYRISGEELRREFVVYLDLKDQSEEFTINSPSRRIGGTRALRGHRFSDQVKRLTMADGAPEALARLRDKKGFSLPESEKADLARYEIVMKERAERLAERLEDERKAKEFADNRATLYDLRKGGQCYFGPPLDNKQNFTGDWTITRHAPSGTKLKTKNQDALWSFDANGGLTGSRDGKPWQAKWSIRSDCRASVTLDAETAAFFDVDRNAKVSLLFFQNGNKAIQITTPNEQTLKVWGTQRADTSIYSYNFGNIEYTRPQLANRCVALDENRKTNATSTSENPAPLILQGRSSSGEFEVFKIDRSSTSALSVGRFNDLDLRTLSVAKGDELAFLDEDGQCAGVLTTGHVTQHQPLSERQKALPFGTVGLVDTTLDFKEAFNASQISNGCGPHQRVTSRLNKDGKTIDRNLYNSGSEDFHVYQVEPQGAYVNPDPILTVKPGEFAKLSDLAGRKYTILDDAKQCVAIVELNSGGKHGIVVGDGSSKIKDPNFVSPVQIANGCLLRKHVRSIYGSTPGAALVSNSGPSDLRVYWVDYDSYYDIARPVLTIKPGQTGKITDFTSAAYVVLNADNKCEAIIQPQFVNQADASDTPVKFQLGDRRATISGELLAPLANAKQQDIAKLTKHQLANSCALTGKIVSKPSSNRGWKRTIANLGEKPLIVQWVSFYGELVDGEFSRKPESDLTIAPGQRKTLYDISFEDVFVVSEEDGQCVAVVQASDKFEGNNSPPVRGFKLGALKETSLLRDKASAEKFDARVARWLADKQTLKDKLADLETFWKRGTCDRGSVEVYSDLRGEWDVGIYDRKGQPKQMGKRPTIWTFKDVFWIDGTLSNGRKFSSQSLPENCIIKPEGSTGDDFKLITYADGSKAFYSAPNRYPEILYFDGTLGDGSHVSGARTEPQLQYWGKKRPSIGPISDTDQSTDEVIETAKTGSKIGIVAYASDLDSEVSYSVATLANERDLFAIDAKTGVIRLAAPLDFEVAQSHRIRVTAKSSDGTVSNKVFTLQVKDTNEKKISEIVDQDNRNNAVDENSSVGARVGIVAFAEDEDASDKVRYSLVDSAGGLFEIDPDTGVVSVAGLLDTEKATRHNIRILAKSDDGSSSQMDAIVFVNDVDEFNLSEISDHDKKSNEIPETARVGSPVGITAFAKDDDRSDKVTYSISDNRGEPFVIDPTTGIITLAGPLDADLVASYTIDVRAWSSDKSSSAREFILNVNRVNQHQISELSDIDGDENSVHEDAAVGALVGVTARANDADTTDTVRYSLSGGIGLFSIDVQTGVVSVAGQLDAETSQSVDINVVATSSDGSVSRSGITIVIVDVSETDVGDVFDHDRRANSVDENAQVGTPVGITGFAMDADSSDRVRYSLFENAGGLFKIDPLSGVVFVNGPLDAETSTNHVVEVSAKSSDGSSTWKKFNIAINDVNEFTLDGSGVGDSPFANRDVSDVDRSPNVVDENSRFGTSVKVTAFVKDEDISDTVRYSLIDDADGAFAIDPKSGVVTVSGALDAEVSDLLVIRFMATSTDGSISEGQREYITVNDVNEFDVSIAEDGDAGANEVAEDAQSGTPVGITAIALDADARTNKVSYHITDANGQRISRSKPFDVGSDSGVVTVDDSDLLDYEDNPNPIVHIRAESADGSYSLQSFVVDLIDVHEAAPEDQRPVDDDQGVLPRNPIHGTGSCDVDRNQIVTQYTDRSAKVEIKNSGSGILNVYWINYSGQDSNYDNGTEPQTVLSPGQTANLEAFRGFGFVIQNEQGDCLGIVQAIESRNSFSFGGEKPVDPKCFVDGCGPMTINEEDRVISSKATCEMRGQIASSTTQDPMHAIVRFHNNGSGNLQIMWANYQGNEGDYENTPNPLVVIGPGQSHELQAYLGYQFVVLDGRRECIDVVTINQTLDEFIYDTVDSGSKGNENPKRDENPEEAPAIADTAPIGTLTSCDMRGQLVSTSKNVAASVSLMNAGSSVMHVYWIGYDGVEGNYLKTPQPVASVAPGEAQSVQAHVGYAFSAFNQDQNCLGIVQVKQAVSRFVLQ